jgi:predicted transcriptional regulator
MYNQARVEIIDFLEHVGRYGAHLREIKSVTNLGSGSLLWHLQVLEDFNLIEKIKVDNYTVFVNTNFAELFNPDLKEIEFNLQSKYTLEVLDMLDTYQLGEEIDLTDVETTTGINRRTLRRLMKKFEQNGLIRIIAGPSLKLEVVDKELLSKIHKSLDLRDSYKPVAPEITIAQMD